jgi:hypothetical protein
MITVALLLPVLGQSAAVSGALDGPLEFAKRLDKQRGACVVVMADPSHQVRKIADQALESDREIERSTGYQVRKVGELVVLVPNYYPKWVVDPNQWRQTDTVKLVDLAKSAPLRSPVTALPGGSAYRVGSLTTVKFDQSVSIHWFLGQFGFQLTRNVPLSNELLTAVAACAGGRIRSARESRTVAFSGQEFSRRVRNSVNFEGFKSSEWFMDRLLQVIVPEVTPAEWEAAYSRPKGGTTWQLRGKPNTLRYVKLSVEAQMRRPQSDPTPSELANWDQMASNLRRFDTSRPTAMFGNADFTVGIMFQERSGPGQMYFVPRPYDSFREGPPPP